MSDPEELLNIAIGDMGLKQKAKGILLMELKLMQAVEVIEEC